MGKSLDFVKKEVDLKKNCFEFGTPEKPWMNSRFVSYLPLKCEIQ